MLIDISVLEEIIWLAMVALAISIIVLGVWISGTKGELSVIKDVIGLGDENPSIVLEAKLSDVCGEPKNVSAIKDPWLDIVARAIVEISQSTVKVNYFKGYC